MTWTSRSAPTWRAWSASEAAISSVSRSVTRATRSWGWTRRHVRTAFRAPGTRSSAYTDRSAVRFCMFGWRSLGRFEAEPVARFVADVVYDFLQISAALFVNSQLPVGPGAVFEDPLQAFDFLARAELVHDVVHELEHLFHQAGKG